MAEALKDPYYKARAMVKLTYLYPSQPELGQLLRKAMRSLELVRVSAMLAGMLFVLLPPAVRIKAVTVTVCCAVLCFMPGSNSSCPGGRVASPARVPVTSIAAGGAWNFV